LPWERRLLDLLFPPRCPFCREIIQAYSGDGRAFPAWIDAESISEILCNRCAADLPWLKVCCPRCSRELTGKGYCSCGSDNYAFENCCALGRYTGYFRETLHFLKYHQKKWVSMPLGRLLSWKLATMSWISSVEGLVPIPISSRRRALRSYNQSDLLARAVGRELNLPVLEALEKVKETESQTGMSRAMRWANLRGTFRPLQGWKGYSHLLIIDDVFTTGATAHEAASALKTMNPSLQVSIAVVAR